MTTSAQFSRGVELIHFERLRQIEEERRDDRHDDSHTQEELARAAACYALPDGCREYDAGWRRDLKRWVSKSYPRPWPVSWIWKPTPDDRVRELTKAGALIAAEIDRLLRAKEAKSHDAQ